MLGRLVEEVCSGPSDILSDITSSSRNGSMGVRDLREVLLEVREQELGPLGEDGQRGVGPHRSVRLLLAIGEKILRSSSCVPERELALEEVGGLRTPVGRGVGELVEVDLTRLQPPRKAAARTTAS